MGVQELAAGAFEAAFDAPDFTGKSVLIPCQQIIRNNSE